MATSKLLYSVVARGSVVLAECSLVSGNAHMLAVRILEKLNSSEDIRVSYAQDRHMFHCMVSDGISYIVVAEEAFGRRIPFGFLEDIRQRFMAAYSERINEAVAYEMNAAFSKVLSERMLYYSNDPSADTINRVKAEVGEVKKIMVENIEKVLERGEKLDLLVDKTEVLQEGANTFRREARRVKQVLWWRNSQMYVVVGGICVALLYLIVASACGWTLSHC